VAVFLPAGRERWLFGGAFAYVAASVLLSLGQCFISTGFYPPHWFGVTVAPLVGTGFATSSTLTALLLAVAISLLLAWRGRWPWPVEGLLIVLAALAVYLTFCRAVYIGLVLGLLLLVLLTNRRREFRRTCYRCLAFVLALAFLHFFMQQIKTSLDAYIWQDRLALQAQVMEKYRSNEPLTAEERAMLASPLSRVSLRVEGKSGINYSARTRLVLAVTLLNNIADRPLWGDGLGGFRREYHRYLPRGLKAGQVDQALERGEEYSPHNTILGLWAEAGVFSFALFVALVALVLLRALRVGLAPPGNGLALGLGFGVVALLLASFFHNILGERLLWVALGVLAAHQAGRAESAGARTAA
jgi:O-antigen ligase